MVKCEICERYFKGGMIGLSHHIGRKHKITSKEYYDRFLKEESEGICRLEGCSKETRFSYLSNGYSKFCSSSHAAKSSKTKKKREKTCTIKYGVRNVFQDSKVKKRIEKTCTKKYGVKNPSQSREIKQKIKETCIEKYGGNCPYQSETVKKKGEETCLENHGVRHAMLSEKVKKRLEEIFLERYGVRNPNQVEERRKYMREGGAAYMNSFIKNPSKPQVELFHLTQKLCPYVTLNYPCIGYSIDIAVPKLSLAIEYDGSCWHQNKSYDERRQKELEEVGWNFIRYIDYVPSKKELLRDINVLLKED